MDRVQQCGLLFVGPGLLPSHLPHTFPRPDEVSHGRPCTSSDVAVAVCWRTPASLLYDKQQTNISGGL